MVFTSPEGELLYDAVRNAEDVGKENHEMTRQVHTFSAMCSYNG